MADADRDSDLGDDSPVIWNCGITVKKSVRSEGESSGEQSCESSDEGVGREIPLIHQPQHLPQHQSLHQPHQPHHNMTHHRNISHQINNHQINHTQQSNSPRPMDRETKGRDDFEALKTSLHPHLSSLASLAQGTSLSAPSSVFSLAGGGANFAYTPPAFLAPAPPPPAQPAGSASSSSSEGSAAGWSFEEQYKQVRQLYEISNDPGRKEFLDELFAFMQKRGSPINRLPIMAKSVLDLYELYNLVIQRGGLVEVINKKLWQEIIKGLKLPSSITSAAFTLRTQYMKYLYDFECEKKNLSTRPELDAAIEGNKREGRRTSGPYEAHSSAMAMPQMNRVASVPATLAQLSPMQTLGLSFAGISPRMPQMPHCPTQFLEAFRFIQQHQEIMRNAGPESPPSTSSTMSPHAAALASLEASHGFFNLGQHFSRTSLDQEPQREALNLSESPGSNGSGAHRREASRPPSPCSSSKRPRSNGHAINHGAGPSSAPHRVPPQLVNVSTSSDDQSELTPPRPFQFGNGGFNGTSGFSFRIIDDESSDTQVSVSMDINGVTYNGTLKLAPKRQNGHREGP